MADIWMDVDVALSGVPVNITPLVPSADPKTRKENLAYNAAGLELIWHFTTTAGATSATVVTPTSGGDYDWAHQDGGMYTIAIPASGGASINNDAEGFGWFTGIATGVLPWRGPIIGFRAAGLNNLLVDSAYSATRGLAGTALPDAAADAAGGLPISDAGGLDLDTYIKRIEGAITATILGRIDAAISTRSSHAASDVKTAVEAAGSHLALIKAKTDNLPASPAAVGSAMTLADDAITAAKFDESTAFPLKSADTGATAVARTGADSDTLETLSNEIAAVTAPTAAAVADAVWDEAVADHAGVGSTGAALAAAGGSGDPWATALPGAYGAGTAGKIVGDNLNATVSSRSSHDAAAVKTAIEAAGSHLALIKAKTDNLPANTSAVLGTPAGASISADVAAIKAETATIVADTNELQTDWHDGGRLDLLLDDAGGAGTPPTVEEIRAELEEAGSHLALIKAKTDSLTFTVAGDVDCNVQTWKGSAAQDMTGDAYARLGAPAGASVSADVAAVKSETAAIVTDTNELQTDLTNGGRLDLILDGILEDTGTTIPALLGTPAGASLAADIAAIEAQTDDIGVAGAGLTAVPWNAAWDAEVQSECADAITAAGLSTLDAAGVRTAVGMAGADLDAQLAALPTAAEVADKFLGRSLAGGADGGRTVTQALRALRNKIAIAAGTMTVYEEDDTTPDWTGAVTTDPAAEPITEIDPA